MAQGLAVEFVELGTLMAKFQCIEIILKLFKTINNFKVSKQKGADSPEHSTLELENFTLGKFLKENEKLNLIVDESILERLGALKDSRNYVAHKGFLVISDLPYKRDFFGYETNPINYPKLNNELDEVIKLLLVQYQNMTKG